MDGNCTPQHVESPAGVSFLMRELYGRYMKGGSLSGNNVFMVDLPPATSDEPEVKRNCSSQESDKPNNQPPVKLYPQAVKYRDIFLKANPHKVNDAIGYSEVNIGGRKVLMRTEQAFDICKGLNLFASGEKYDIDEDVHIEKIKRKNPKLTSLQARVSLHGLKGYMGSALDALGMLPSVNRDQLMNQWLNQEIESSEEIDATTIASKLISDIVNR